jgi:DedD protein
MKHDRRQAGWISTLVALVGLVVVGFLCGAFAGFLWEEPGLVLAYLSGKTEPVSFDPNAAPSEPAPVAAPPPTYSQDANLPSESAEQQEPELAERPEQEPEAALAAPPRAELTEVVREKPPAPAPTAVKPADKPAEKKPAAAPAPAKKPAVVASVPTGRFSVQVGAFGDRASADKLVARLRSRGYDSYVKADSEGGAKRYRVRVGPVNARTRAEELAAKLKGEKLPTWILDENKG